MRSHLVSHFSGIVHAFLSPTSIAEQFSQCGSDVFLCEREEIRSWYRFCATRDLEEASFILIPTSLRGL